jgi:hypothetical protein
LSDIYDRRDALDALVVNVAWQQMVAEMRERQEAIVRSMVSEQSTDAERSHLAVEYRMIETFIAWPNDYRQALEGVQE